MAGYITDSCHRNARQIYTHLAAGTLCYQHRLNGLSDARKAHKEARRVAVDIVLYGRTVSRERSRFGASAELWRGYNVCVREDAGVSGWSGPQGLHTQHEVIFSYFYSHLTAMSQIIASSQIIAASLMIAAPLLWCILFIHPLLTWYIPICKIFDISYLSYQSRSLTSVVSEK